MKLHKVEVLFKQEDWLRGFLDRQSDYMRWVEREVRSICFYDFKHLNLNATYQYQDLEFDYGDGQTRSVQLHAGYSIVYRLGTSDLIHCQYVEDNCWGLPFEQQMTVAKKIRELVLKEKEYEFEFIAVVRCKCLSSAPGDFGVNRSFDIFKFPKDWTPDALK